MKCRYWKISQHFYRLNWFKEEACDSSFTYLKRYRPHIPNSDKEQANGDSYLQTSIGNIILEIWDLLYPPVEVGILDTYRKYLIQQGDN